MSAYRSSEQAGALVATVRSARWSWRRPWSFARGGHDLRIYEDGLAIDDTFVAREGVREVRTIEWRTTREVHLLDKHEIRLTRPDRDDALDAIYRFTLPHLLEGARASLSGGARFGPLVADESGVRNELVELRWDRIAEISLQRTRGGLLIVRGRDHTWIEVPLAEVTNPHVLIALQRERSTIEPAPGSVEGETAYTALKRLTEAQERGPDAVTAPLRPLSAKGRKSFDSSQ